MVNSFARENFSNLEPFRLPLYSPLISLPFPSPGKIDERMCWRFQFSTMQKRVGNNFDENGAGV
jgi:hypothetical protein